MDAMTRYEVELETMGYLYVEVEADDEDEARDAAQEVWKEYRGDIDLDTPHVLSVTELEATA